jgi:ribosomal protein S14
MKTLLGKEQKKRKQYFKYYLKRLCLKSIHANRYLPLQSRWEAFNQLTSFPLRSRIAKLKNRCLLTNRNKAILKNFKISRISLRSCLANGFLTGFERACW